MKIKFRSTDPAVLDARKQLKVLRDNLVDARRGYRQEKVARQLSFADDMRKLKAEYEDIYKSLTVRMEELKPFAAYPPRRKRRIRSVS